MKHLKYKVIYSWSKRLKTLRGVMADITQVTQNTPQTRKSPYCFVWIILWS